MSKFQLTGLLIMCTALGVNAANYSPLVTNVSTGVNYGLHFLLIIFLVIGAILTSSGRAGGQVLVNVAICLTWAFDVFAIVWGMAHPDPNAFGPHNFNDYSPVGIFTVGAILWFIRGTNARTGSDL